MAWTYDVSLLATSQLMQVRLLIQDTQSTRPLVQDEEVQWYLSQEANVYMAAAMACESLIAKAGNVKSKSVADLSLSYDLTMYRGLATTLRSRGASHQLPFVGGISEADKLTQQNDSDAVQPRMFRGLGDHPGASNPSPGAVDNPLTRVP